MSKASALVDVGKKRVNPLRELWQNKFLYLLALPAIAYTFIFSYLTLPYIVIAFEKFNYKTGIFSPFVGLANFEYFFKSSWAWTVTRNTLVINILFLLVGTVCAVLLAIVLNEVKAKRFLKVSQSMMLFPYFISWVVIGGILVNLLSPSWGIVNDVIKTMGGEPVFFLGSDKYFRAIAVVSHIWKQAGWDTIIYLAAITAVNPDLYEAAKIDGAGNFQRIWHVTIPCIKPTIVILLLISIGNILNNGFEQIYVLQNGSNLAVSEVFETYTYKMGLVNGRYSFATSVSLFSSVVGFVLLSIGNRCAKLMGEEGLF